LPMNTFVAIILVIALLTIVVSVLLFRRHRKTANLKQ
jgi:hypothetical protein